MRRDGLTSEEADSMIRVARQEVIRWATSDGEAGRDPETILFEDFSLEPDFIYDLIPYYLL